MSNTNIRNVAIVAHVDHGKTTLVDAFLKQSRVFRENQQVGTLIMDSNELEREKGITILAKNTAIEYRGVKINIIDTPGHADFSGEVERVLNMADGFLLVVDAVEGPMPQTRIVLRKALERGLRPIVIINKIDRPAARPKEVAEVIQDLFLALATDVEQLDFPILYADARDGYAVAELGDEPKSIQPVLDAILAHVPPPGGDPEGPFQFQAAALAYDNYLGQLAIGRIFRGRLRPRDSVVRIAASGVQTPGSVERLFTFYGLERREVSEALAGDIVAIAGMLDSAIGDTLAAPDRPEALPPITVEEPAVEMTVGVSTSPFSGREGRAATSRELRARLFKELQTDVALRVQETDSADVFLVAGRGELHLAILIEKMRREGMEFQVSRPTAVIKIVNGITLEPYEVLTLSTPDQYVGTLTEELAARLALLQDMRSDGQGTTHMEFKVPTRGVIGFRSFFLRATRGDGVMSTVLLGFEPRRGEVRSTRSGVLVASEAGIVASYGLSNAQERGLTFVEPGAPVYEGMVVGFHARDTDMNVNICKEKKQTNVRASTSDIAVKLTPPIVMSLEESLDFIADDEFLEVTPKNLRVRKRALLAGERYRLRRAGLTTTSP
ncbi:MAG: translational GTPase TypA [Chloroflexi bacterium]|nr:translational GTPase TypA [Chloroflexota bacterium]